MNARAPFPLEHTYAADLEGMYADWEPAGFPKPELVLLNRPLGERLGLDNTWLEQHAASVLSGSSVPEGAKPIAQAYAGHQFGNFNPQLGDGRAVLLGEVVAPDGKRFDIQLKGSGTTPFSRRGDGRAALDSALREYIVSEAMHALGVPTTRSLAVVTTGETIVRERRAPGAVLTRVASSHIRVGTLEFFAARKEFDKLERLVDYTLKRHFPQALGAERPAKALLDAVAEVQAKLVAHWMLIGFIHGVMNTDNVTLSGETIDYGPCAFMDTYDPQTVFSGIDQYGRYAYGNQPAIGSWNLARMAEALLVLMADDPKDAIEPAQASLDRFTETLDETWKAGMRAKLGLAGDEGDSDTELVRELFNWMREEKKDYTSTFRHLATSLRTGEPAFGGEAFSGWNQRWAARLGDADRMATADGMDAINPIYVVRNHKIEEALSAALDGDLQPTRTMMEVLSKPFEAQPGREAYAEPAPEAFGRTYQTHCNT